MKGFIRTEDMPSGLEAISKPLDERGEQEAVKKDDSDEEDANHHLVPAHLR